jgi:polysaccharide biosynthesis transport protein
MKPNQPRFDSQSFVQQAVSYIKYGRLMILLVCLGLLFGLGYYTYAKALYRSKAKVLVRVFDLPFHDKSTDPSAATPSRWRRSLLTDLYSPDLLIRTAQRMGIIGSDVDIDDLRNSHIPIMRLELIDNDTLAIDVQAYKPQVVRDFPRAFIQEYISHQEKLRGEYRERALAKFNRELDAINARIESKIKEGVDLERDADSQETYVKLQELINVRPRILYYTKRLEQIGEARRELDNLNEDQVIDKLLVLSRLDQAKDLIDLNPLFRRPDGRQPLASTEVSAKNLVQLESPGQAKVEEWKPVERELNQVIGEIKASTGKYLPTSDTIRGLERRRDQLQGQLAAFVENNLKKTNLEEQEAREQIKQLEAKESDYHAVNAKFAQFTHGYEIARQSKVVLDDVYKRLWQDIEAAQLGANKSLFDLEVQDWILLNDVKPFSPSKKRLAILGLMLGLGMALGVPFALETFRSTASRLQQLEVATGLPGIGIVPLVDRQHLENIIRSPSQGSKVPDFLLENFRLIRSNIALHPKRRGERSQVIMVTSSRPSEGKTSQSANLGWAFNSVGERTLIIDADLRRGRQHKIFKRSSKPGLSELLCGMVEPHEVIQKSEVDNLDFIPKGAFIPGSTELLCQEGFVRLVSLWRGHYDRIILDTPPVLGLSETTSLQRVVDGVVLVVKADSTRTRDVKDAVDMLRNSGAHFFGLVMNQVDLSKTEHFYHYSYYAPQYDYLYPGPDDGDDGDDAAGTPATSPRPNPAAPKFKPQPGLS